MSYSFTTHIDRGDDELAVRVTYEVSRYYPATHLQPAEGGDCEIVSATFIDVDAASLPAPLTDAEYEVLQAVCEERAQDDAADAASDYADYLYEQHKERRMMAQFEQVAS